MCDRGVDVGKHSTSISSIFILRSQYYTNTNTDVSGSDWDLPPLGGGVICVSPKYVSTVEKRFFVQLFR